MKSGLLELIEKALGADCPPGGLDWSRIVVVRNIAPLYNGGRPEGDFMWNRGLDLMVLDHRGDITHFCKVRPADNIRVLRATRFRQVLCADAAMRHIVPHTTLATDDEFMVQASRYVRGQPCGLVLAGLNRDQWAGALGEILDTNWRLLSRGVELLPELRAAEPVVNLAEAARENLVLLEPDMDPAEAAALRSALEAGGSVPRRIQHGDLWPPNILHDEHGWVLLDYESLGEVTVPGYDLLHMLRAALAERLGDAAPPRWLDALGGPTAEAAICRSLFQRRADRLGLTVEQRIAVMVYYLIDLTAKLRRREAYLIHSQPFFDDLTGLAAELAAGGAVARTIAGTPRAVTVPAPAPLSDVPAAASVVEGPLPDDTQGAPLQRVGSHGIIYAAGILLSKTIAFLMLPVYTRYLTTSDYGTLQLIELTFEIVSIVAGSRLAAGVFHFYHKAKSQYERRAVLFTSFVVMACSFLIATGAAYLAAPTIAELVFRSRENAGLVRIAAAGLAFQGLFAVPMAYLQLRERSRQVVALNAMKLLTQLTLNIVFVVGLGLGARGMLISSLIGNAVFGTMLAVWFMRDAGVAWSGRALVATLRFGLPFVMTQIGTFVSTYGDRYFLQRAADEDAVGVYGLAYQFGFLVATLGYFPFASIWDPIRFETAKRPDREIIYARAFIYFSTVYLTLAVVISLGVFDFLRVMTTAPFWPAATFVPVILMAYIFQGWTDFLNIGVMIRERTGLITLANWVAAAVAIAAYAILIPRYYGMGAAIATAIAFWVRLAMVYYFSQRLWPIRYQWAPVAKLFTLAVVIVVANGLLPAMPLALSVLVRASLFGAYLLGVWLLRVLSDEDFRQVVALVRHPRQTMADLRRVLMGGAGPAGPAVPV